MKVNTLSSLYIISLIIFYLCLYLLLDLQREEQSTRQSLFDQQQLSAGQQVQLSSLRKELQAQQELCENYV